ncbi:hypothetical protein ACTS9T_03615 [Empedobacter falsenii]
MRVKINSFPEGAIVRNENFDIIGKTPIFIQTDDFQNQFVYINYGIDSRKVSISDDLEEINVTFEVNEKQTETNVQTETLEAEIQDIGLVEINQEVNKNRVNSNRVNSNIKYLIILGFIVVLIAAIFGLNRIQKEKHVVNLEQQLPKTDFASLTNEEKIKHYLFFEDRRDYHYLKSLLDLNNLHYWDVDNISETLLDKAFSNDNNRISNSKNEVLTINKVGEMYKVDVKYIYINKYNEQKEKFPKIYFGFSENGLINYINNKPRN